VWGGFIEGALLVLAFSGYNSFIPGLDYTSIVFIVDREPYALIEPKGLFYRLRRLINYRVPL
jgi:hypothetical protein